MDIIRKRFSFQGNCLQHVQSDVITEKELQNLRNFRNRINDVQLDWFLGHDKNLVRWLRAREQNLAQAEEMFRKNLDWKEMEDMGNILTRGVPEYLIQEFPFQVTGFDKDGDIVALIPYGQWDFRSLVERGLRHEFVNYINYIIEFAYKFLKSRSSSDRIYNKAVLILDMQGFALKQVLSKPTIEMLLEMMQSLEDNHPECLKRAYMINAAKVFELLWAIAKPLLTQRTLSKVDIFGYNEALWKLKILTSVSAENLPSQYGGGNTNCPKIGYYIDKIANIDPSREFKLNLHQNRAYNEDDMITVKVPAYDKFRVHKSVPHEGFLLRWGFTTDEHDISFLILNEDDEKVVEVTRVDSHRHPQLGTYVCPSAGDYRFVFDNSYNRFWAKTLHYIIEVCDPEDDLENSDTILQSESEEEEFLDSKSDF